MNDRKICNAFPFFPVTVYLVISPKKSPPQVPESHVPIPRTCQGHRYPLAIIKCTQVRLFVLTVQWETNIGQRHIISLCHIFLTGRPVLHSIHFRNFIDHKVLPVRSVTDINKMSGSVFHYIPTMCRTPVGPRLDDIRCRRYADSTQGQSEESGHVITSPPLQTVHFFITHDIRIFGHACIITHRITHGNTTGYLLRSIQRIQPVTITLQGSPPPVRQRFMSHPIRQYITTEIIK